MMDWTDRHCRYLHRQISHHTLLYTEMVTAPALLHGDRARLLRFDPAEHPVALQIGGSDPAELAEAARIGEAAGYDEINLNVGCPSDRVQSGRFGACLMAEPELVAKCLRAMKEAVAVDVTVKCRIGIDDQNPEETLPEFIQTIANQGITSFTIHARKAWLDGLSPKENRTIPPLNYPLVYKMKSRFPELEIILNGGLETLADAQNAMKNGLDGAMIGRAAYHEPMNILGTADQVIGLDTQERNACQVVEAMKTYIEGHITEGGALHHISRHMLGLFAGQPGARAWRRYISENAHQKNADWSVIANAIEQVEHHQEKVAQNA